VVNLTLFFFYFGNFKVHPIDAKHFSHGVEAEFTDLRWTGIFNTLKGNFS